MSQQWTSTLARTKTVQFLRKIYHSFIRRVRISKFATRILGPQCHTNLNRIEIDITWHCNLLCKNCNRSCRQAPTTEQMTIEQIKKFIQESIQNQKKWEYIRIVGGEPTLHPNILEILSLLGEYQATYSPTTTLVLVSNGYSDYVNNILKQVPKTVIIKNTAKDSPDQPTFESFNIAPIDLPNYKNINFSNACKITTNCGLGLNRYGYYPCAVAGGIDRIFGLHLGKLQLPLHDKETRPVLSVCCRLCGHFFQGSFITKAQLELQKLNSYSPTWEKAYQNFRLHKPDLLLY